MNNIPIGKFLLRLFLCFPILLLQPSSAFAQPQDNTWIFGNQCGLNFSSGTPVPVTAPNPNFYNDEGCASYSDAAGNLLLYTDGKVIRNRNYAPMPNGNPVIPTDPSSTTQAALIVPMPGSVSKYYVFSLESVEVSFPPMQKELYYSVVDMSLDGGLGDVVPGQKGISLGTDFTEKLTAVANGCESIWVMARSGISNEYKAFPVTNAGVGAPVVSSAGTGPLGAYWMGAIRFSPDGKQMAAALHPWNSNVLPGVELYDFNTTTGMLTNARMIDQGTDIFNNFYGVCFSPDNTKLYATIYTGRLYQYDVSLPTTADIIASRELIFETQDYGLYDMRLGRDNRVYIAAIPITPPSSYLHRIDLPNLTGAACQFVPQAVALPAGTTVRMGLPNAVIVLGNPETAVTSARDTTTCQPITLQATRPAAAHTWNTGATTASITTTGSGTYWVRYKIDCTYYVDTFRVHSAGVTRPDLGPDVHVCEGDAINVPMMVALNGTQTALWSDGSTGSSLTATEPGTYWVRISDKGCSEGDTLVITRRSCDCFCQVPSAFSPNNDGRNDFFTPITGKRCAALKKYTLSVYNRWGELVYQGTQAHKGWDGNYRGKTADAGTYMYVLRFYDTENAGEFDRTGDVTLVR